MVFADCGILQVQPIIPPDTSALHTFDIFSVIKEQHKQRLVTDG